MTSIVRRGGLLTDYYSYDGLGRQLKHWNSMLGSSNAETTDYDALGRVTSSRAFGGDVTGTSYVWSAATNTSGMGTFGGWTETTTYANGKTLVETSDSYGRLVAKKDLGDVYSYDLYDAAGRRTFDSASGLNLAWYNTGQLAGVATDASNYNTLSYDANGNKTGEVTYRAGANVQNATAGYDALGRLTSWTEAGSATSPAASLAYEYDLNGNIRHAYSERRILDGAGTAGGTVQSWNDWYLYDSMNRVVRDKGSLLSGAITGGTLYSYDLAGRRATATNYVQLANKLWRHQPTWGQVTWWDYQEDLGGGSWSYTNYNFSGNRTESYAYNTDGTLASVSTTQDIATGSGQATPYFVAMGSGASLKASFTTDAMGRVTRQIDWLGNGTDAGYDRSVVYDSEGQITSETVATKQGGDIWTSYVTNTYGTGSSDALGSALSTTTQDYKNGIWQYQTTTTNTYAWYDGAVQDYLTYAKTGQSTYTTDYILNGAGQLTSATIQDGRPRTVTYLNDMNGQVLRRDEQLTAGSSNDPHEVWYRFNGRQLGFTGNNGSLDSDYTTSIATRTQVAPATPGAFRNGATNGQAAFEFDPSLQRINSYRQGGAGGSYTVKAGDTLQGIAAMLWGDSNLWYKLAEANGLSSASGLSEGRALTIPAGIQANSHNAATFRPYDAADAIGETSPVNPKPSKKNNQCGAFGAILLTVVAVAVTALLRVPVTSLITGALKGAVMAGTMSAATAGAVAAAGVPSIVGATLAGAAGSIASQGVGLATGIQDKFSFKQVALAGLSAAAGAGLGQIGGLNGATGLAGIAQDAARGMFGNAAVQGVSVLTGLQSKFDFAGVAAAGATGGALGLTNLGGFAGQLLSGTAGAIAGGAARSLIDGSSFGDNIIRALPDVIGATIGESLSRGLTGRASSMSVDEAQALGCATADITAKASGSKQISQYYGSGVVGEAVEDVITVTAQVRDWFTRMMDGIGEFLFGDEGRTQWQRDELTLQITVGPRGRSWSPHAQGSRSRSVSAPVTRWSFRNIDNSLGRITAPLIGPGTIIDRAITQPTYAVLRPVGNVLSVPLVRHDNHVRTLNGEIFERRSEGAITVGDLLVVPAARMAQRVRLAPAVRAAGPIVAEAGAFSARSSVLRNVFANANGMRSAAEIRGLKYTIRGVERQGYELTGALHYRGNQGIDLVFDGLGSNAGRYALAEAKASRSLGSLTTDTLGIRQGSEAFFTTRLERAGRLDLTTEMARGNVDLFGGFSGPYVDGLTPHGRLFQFNPTIFTRNQNLRTTPGAAARIGW